MTYVLFHLWYLMWWIICLQLLILFYCILNIPSRIYLDSARNFHKLMIGQLQPQWQVICIGLKKSPFLRGEEKQQVSEKVGFSGCDVRKFEDGWGRRESRTPPWHMAWESIVKLEGVKHVSIGGSRPYRKKTKLVLLDFFTYSFLWMPFLFYSIDIICQWII